MKLYHGTILNHQIDIEKNGINLEKSKSFLDFGRGFYTTPDFKMAKDMALKIAKRNKRLNNPFPTVLCFEYTENPQLNYKIFEKEDMEWAKFILSNRLTPELGIKLNLTDNNHDLKYDIIIGGTADGNIATIAADLRYEKLQIESFQLDLSMFLKTDGTSYGTQITFCTQKALSCIKYVDCDIIYNEKRWLSWEKK